MPRTKATTEVKEVKTSKVKTVAKETAVKTASKTTAVKAKISSAAKSETITFTHDDVANRAYEIYLTRNGFSGDQISDWFQAETELKNRLN